MLISATFTVLCYNVLCDKYATVSQYSYCPSWALNWEYRKQSIIKEIKNYEADIITLQVGFKKDRHLEGREDIETNKCWLLNIFSINKYSRQSSFPFIINKKNIAGSGNGAIPSAVPARVEGHGLYGHFLAQISGQDYEWGRAEICRRMRYLLEIRQVGFFLLFLFVNTGIIFSWLRKNSTFWTWRFFETYSEYVSWDW